MKDMLDAMDHRRPVGALRNVHHALEAQEIGAAMLSECVEGIRLKNPMVGSLGCCARAASGQAAPPPRSEMNSRLLMGRPPQARGGGCGLLYSGGTRN